MNNDPLPLDEWLAYLAVLLNPTLPGEMLPALSRLRSTLDLSFAPRVFTPLSAKAVAGAERHAPCPDWSVFDKVLTDYVKTFVPTHLQRHALAAHPDALRLAGPVVLEPEPEKTPEVLARVAEKLRLVKAEIREHVGANPMLDRTPPTPRYLTAEQLRAACAQQGCFDPRAPREVAAPPPPAAAAQEGDGWQ